MQERENPCGLIRFSHRRQLLEPGRPQLPHRASCSRAGILAAEIRLQPNETKLGRGT